MNVNIPNQPILHVGAFFALISQPALIALSLH
jgi:hypothetical protein